MKISRDANKLFSDALCYVESKSIREWAQSPHNGPIWLEICQTDINNGRRDPQRMATYIVAEAIGL